MVIPLFIGIAIRQVAQTKPDFDLHLKTFRQAFEPLAREAGFRLEVSEKVANSPVVISFNAKGDPIRRLTDLCTLLGLESEKDSDKQVIKISISQKNVPTVSDSQRVKLAISKLRETLKLYEKMDVRQRYEESRRLYALYFAEQDRIVGGQLSNKANLLAKACRTRDSIPISLLLNTDGDQLASIITNPYSRLNQLPLGPGLNDLAMQVINGRGLEDSDLMDPKRIKPDDLAFPTVLSEQFRQFHVSLNVGDPIIHFSHTKLQDGFLVMLRVVNPYRDGILSSFGLPFEPMSIAFPDQKPLPELDIRLLPEPVFHDSNYLSINSLGVIGAKQGLDYAGWLDQEMRFRFQGNVGTIKSAIATSGFESARVQTLNSAITIRNYHRPIPVYNADWRPFIKVLVLINGQYADRKVLLPLLDSFSEAERKTLSQIPKDALFTEQTYSGIFYASSLYRIAFHELKPGQDTATIAIKSLPKASREDFLQFMLGDYVWNYYPSYQHALNAGLLLEATMKVKVTAQDDHHQVHLDISVPALGKGPQLRPIEFDLDVL